MAKQGTKVVVHFGQDKKATNALVASIISNGGNLIATQAYLRIQEEVAQLFNKTTNLYGLLNTL